MSRVGRKPIPISEKIKVTLKNRNVSVEGPKGKLDLELPPRVNVIIESKQIVVEKPGNDRQSRALFGLTRSLIANHVKGVQDGYVKELDIEGVGFRAAVSTKSVELSLGFSHPVVFPIPEGIQIKVDKQTHVTVTGIDKHLVGQTAANIRALYEAEPYKGKGIRYTGERVRRKQGKKVT